MKRAWYILLLAGAVQGQDIPTSPVAPGAAASAAPKKDLSASVTTRLSWAPYNYLRQGFRNAPWINDPFFPESRMLTVTGLVSDEMAYINGHWYKIGEKIEGYTVKSIRPEGVTLARANELLHLKLKER